MVAVDSLDKIAVGISTVHTPDLANCTGSVYDFAAFEDLASLVRGSWSVVRTDYLDTSALPTFEYIVDGMIGNEAKIFAARLHTAGLWLEFMATQM
jgi:hypothetical protein